MTNISEPRYIASTAGQVSADLASRGVASDQRVTVLLEPEQPEDWLTKPRRFGRPKVVAEGWSDADIDRIIEEERDAVQPSLE